LEAISVSKPDDQIPKFDLQSEDITEARHQELLQLFPEVHTESGGINFDALRISLGDAVNVGSEAFGMSWPGKAECAKVIQRQSIATLLPVVDESVNWDTTENVIIEGDNLEVLKVLQKAYLGKVKMIYIDPPYNTGSDFIYPDNYTESLKTYLQYTGQVDDEGNKFSTNTESSGRFHSKWMNMMYPRLSLARDLLTADGIIFISIDDHEFVALMQMCSEIFGEENHIATLIWPARTGGQDTNDFALQHEYVLAVAKNRAMFEAGRDEVGAGEFPLTDSETGKKYKRQMARKWGNNSKRADRPNLWYSVQDEVGNEVWPLFPDGTEGRWRWEKNRFANEILSGNVEFVSGVGESVIAYEKVWEPQSGNKSIPFTTIFDPDKVGTTATGTADIKLLFGAAVFPYPKPVSLITHLMEMGGVSGSDLVVDFFAGSGTTGEAVMQFNAVRGQRISFMLIQLPEDVAPDTEAANAGFRRISELTRKRLNLASEKLDYGNLGFRSFGLRESNFAVWDAGAIAGDEKKLEQELFAQVEHVLPGRTNQDILFELMLKSRYQLTTPVESVMVGKCELWKVASGEMVAVMDSGLTVEVIREIASWKPTSVVVLDRCFAGDDSLKANARKIFEDARVDLKTV
jgi:adenine-specific DNA-methyltransferase